MRYAASLLAGGGPKTSGASSYRVTCPPVACSIGNTCLAAIGRCPLTHWLTIDGDTSQVVASFWRPTSSTARAIGLISMPATLAALFPAVNSVANRAELK